jgi:uncharacterized protein YraI
MTLMGKLMTGAGLLALSTGFAAAAPAVVENDLNLRAGPGIEYPVVAAMPSGATVDVMTCQAGWCRVAFNGTVGWASRAFIGTGGGVAVAPATRGYIEGYSSGGYAPGYGYETYGYGSYGPGYSNGYTTGYSSGVGYSGGYGYTDRRAFSSERRLGDEGRVSVRGEGRFGEGAVRTERRVGESTSVRTGSSISARGSVRGERRGSRVQTTGSAREETQTPPDVKGNNPMKAEKSSGAVTNARAPTEVQGNNPMKVGGNNAGVKEQRGTAQPGGTRGAARTTTGAAPRESNRSRESNR